MQSFLKYLKANGFGKLMAFRLFAVILLLVIIVPYYSLLPAEYSKNGKFFSSNFADHLQDIFENGNTKTLKAELEAESIHYTVSPDTAIIEVLRNKKTVGQSFEITIHSKFLIGLKKFNKINLLFSMSATENDKRLVISKFNQNLLKAKASKKFSTNFYADFYAHIIAIIFTLVLLYLFLHNWPRNFTYADWPLLPIMLLAVFNLFVLTTPTISDIKLHFFNEMKQSYEWGVYGPGGFALQTLLYRIFPMSDQTLFNANRIFSLSSLIPFYLLVKRLFDCRISALAATFMLISSPLWLRYGASDLAFAWSSFLFFSSLALLSGRKSPNFLQILIAIFAMAIAMLSRAEYMMFAISGVLLLGYQRIAFLFKYNLKPMLFALFSAIILLLPQVIYTATNGQELVFFDFKAMLATCFGVQLYDGYNTYADLQYSSWLHILATATGFLLLLTKRWKLALALFLSTTLFLWNPYYFYPVFSSTHYQHPALIFYTIAAGFSFGMLIKFTAKKTGRLSAAVFVLFLALFLTFKLSTDFKPLLHTSYTYQQQYHFLADNSELIKDDATLLYFKPFGDHDLHNPERIWFATPSRFKATINLAEQKLPDSFENTYYIKTPGCYVTNLDDPENYNLYYDKCKQIESLMVFEPVKETFVRAKAAVGELYFAEQIPVGIFRVIQTDK